MGTVDEPYLTGTPDVGAFAGRWMYFGFTFGEAACASQAMLSWQTTVVGDPLYRPFGKNAQEVHQSLIASKSRLLEWSTIRLGNLSRNQGMSAAELAAIIEDMPLTKESAVLTEKLADLYVAQGKPASAIAAYERTLTLDPTPQQRIRLRLTLGEKYVTAKNDELARKSYEKLLEENPDYTDAIVMRKKINTLTPMPLINKDSNDRGEKH
jgi:tetratricopeptide (TPR) repeat protein